MTPQRLIKALLVIAGMLGFALVGTLVLRRPSRPSAPFTGAVDSTEKITLQTGAVQIELHRGSATWTVSAGSDGLAYPAAPEPINILLNGLKNLRVEDVISERPDRASDFDINPGSATVLTLFGKTNERLAAGVFGKQAPDSAHLYFKYPDQPAVYLARGTFRGELGQPDVKAWRDRTVLNITEDQVLTVFIQGPGFKTALARSSDTWSCNGKVVDPVQVWGTLGILAHIKAEDFVDPGQDPALTARRLKYATVTLQLRDGRTRELHIGRIDPKAKRYPVAVDNDPAVAWINEGVVKAILKKPAEFNLQRR